MEAALSQRSMHHVELALRMVVGVVLGGLIGWERNVEDRHFGLMSDPRSSATTAACRAPGKRSTPPAIGCSAKQRQATRLATVARQNHSTP